EYERWVIDQKMDEDHRDQTNRQVDEEDPAPGVVIGEPSTQGRTECGRAYRRDCIERKRETTFFRRKDGGQNCLRHRLQAAAPSALNHARQKQKPETWGDPAKQGRNREDGNADKKKTLAPNDG